LPSALAVVELSPLLSNQHRDPLQEALIPRPATVDMRGQPFEHLELVAQ
jgi:hypothetical protein